MSWLEILEALSYAVTIVGFPFAIVVFLAEKRKERMNEEEELYLQLADAYEKFLKLVLENADLRLTTDVTFLQQLTEEQRERRNVLFEILVGLFERAYILVYEDRMSRQAGRLWQTWEDYMREWCRRADFREMLPRLLEGEDPDFREHITRIAAEEAKVAALPMPVGDGPAKRRPNPAVAQSA